MAARRLITVLIVVLLVSSVAAALVPIERSSDDSSSTTTAERPPPAPLAGDVITRRIPAEPRKPAEIRMRVGDELRLTVESNQPDQVEIPALDQVEPVDAGSPAHFDLLPDQARAYAVQLGLADHTVGRIIVKPRLSGSGRRS